MDIPNNFRNAKIVSVNTDPTAYHAQTVKRGDPKFVMSQSQLKDFAECPHKWLMNEEEEDTESLIYGSLLDCLVLTPSSFEERYIVRPEQYSNEKGEMKDWNNNANVCKRWNEDHADKTIIKSKLLHEANTAKHRLYLKEWINQIVNDSDAQVMITAEYRDHETGFIIPVQAMLDLLPKKKTLYGKTIPDLKTCASASESAWPFQVDKYGYDIQAAMYIDIVNTLPGEDRTDFTHICSENTPPYESAFYILSQEFIQIGRMKYTAAFERYAKCVTTNTWPGYGEEGNRPVFQHRRLIEPTPFMVSKYYEP